MNPLNEEFLLESGFQELPSQERKKLLSILQDEVMERAGDILIAGLSQYQIQEYQQVLQGISVLNLQWLQLNYPEFQQEEVFLDLIARGYEVNDAINEATKELWIRDNCPEYIQIVRCCIEQVMKEVLIDKEAILEIYCNDFRSS